jgi:hypothetical protein
LFRFGERLAKVTDETRLRSVTRYIPSMGNTVEPVNDPFGGGDVEKCSLDQRRDGGASGSEHYLLNSRNPKNATPNLGKA